jgi:hypothetical protein
LAVDEQEVLVGILPVVTLTRVSGWKLALANSVRHVRCLRVQSCCRSLIELSFAGYECEEAGEIEVRACMRMFQGGIS